SCSRALVLGRKAWIPTSSSSLKIKMMLGRLARIDGPGVDGGTTPVSGASEQVSSTDSAAGQKARRESRHIPPPIDCEQHLAKPRMPRLPRAAWGFCVGRYATVTSLHR